MMWTYMFAYFLRTELTMCFQDKVGHRTYTQIKAQDALEPPMRVFSSCLSLTP